MHLLRLADADVVYVLMGLMFMAGASFFVRFADTFAHLGPKEDSRERALVLRDGLFSSPSAPRDPLFLLSPLMRGP